MKIILLIFKGTVFLLLLLFGLQITDRLLYPDNGTVQNWQSFYEQKEETVDVLIVGSSHAFSTFDTDLMGQILGEKAYLLASYSEPVTTTYYNLKEMLRYQSPRTVILEAYEIRYGPMDDGDVKKLADTDGMRCGPGRAEAILNLYEPKNWANAFFTILRSHTGWKDTQQIQTNWEQWKGHMQDFSPFRVFSESQMSSETAALYEQMSPNEAPIQIDETTKNDFRKLADLCRNNGIELVVVMAPMYKGYVGKINYQSWHDELADLCAQAQTEFIDCNELYETIGMEQTDFEDTFDENHHLNRYGAEKVTRYIAHSIEK